MKKIEHKACGESSICIYEHTETKIRGSFFSSEKPEVGDLINTAFKRYDYEVLNIIENRDACINLECDKDPKNALFILEVKRCNN